MQEKSNDLYIQKEIIDDYQYAIKEYVEGGSKKTPVLVAKGKWIKDKFKSDDWDEIIAKYDRCEGGKAYEVHVFDKGTTETKAIYRSIAPTMRVNESGQYEEKQVQQANQMALGAGLNDFMGDIVAKTESRYLSETQGLRNDLSEVRSQLRDFTVENANLKAENEKLKTQYEMEQKLIKVKEDMENNFDKELSRLENKSSLGDNLSGILAPLIQAAAPTLVDYVLRKFGGNNQQAPLQVPTQQEIQNGMIENASTD